MKEKTLEFFKKHRASIIVWICGIAALYFVHSTSEKRPEFVEEYEIVTWAEVKSYIIVFWCVIMCSNGGFWRYGQDTLFYWGGQNKWADELKKNMSQSEAKIGHLFDLINASKNEIELLTKKLGEKLSINIIDIHESIYAIEKSNFSLTSKYESLKRLLDDHLHDCEPVFQCESCNREFNEMCISKDPDGDYPICQYCHAFEVGEKKVIRHLNNKT